MKTLKFVLPNLVTSIRIIGAVAILFLEPLSLPFYLVYGLCGLSDALDGFLARKLGASSRIGSLLDSVSDLIFYSVMAVVIFPTLYELLSLGNWLVILIPVGLQLIGYIICAIKFRKFSALHTYANKALSVIVFAFPFSFIGYIYLLYNLYIYIGCIVAFYAGIEIILIHLWCSTYNERNKSIFLLKRNEIETRMDVKLGQ